MVVKVNESFQKPRDVKKTTTNLKRNARYHEKILSNKKNLIILSIFSMIRIDTELKISVYTNISTNFPMIYHTLM